MVIRVITTGGTIGALPYDDPRHPPAVSTMPADGRDIVAAALARDFQGFDIHHEALDFRDSKQIDDAYRHRLLARIAANPDQGVLITHGTDTILETADFLCRQPALAGHAVILVGAMTPLANGPDSDGHANLAFALDRLNRTPAVGVGVVLSDFDDTGAWKPRYYAHEPGTYRKFHDADGRYNRLVPVG
jgi:L-asparaginase